MNKRTHVVLSEQVVKDIDTGRRKNNALLSGSGSLQFYPVPFRVAELAGTLKREHSKKGITLSMSDVLIAAVAIHNQLTLIMDNIKDFPMNNWPCTRC
jgi:predicted nucleic acid-binding protein